jgi:ketosteroid isomerase-like protein
MSAKITLKDYACNSLRASGRLIKETTFFTQRFEEGKKGKREKGKGSKIYFLLFAFLAFNLFPLLLLCRRRAAERRLRMTTSNAEIERELRRMNGEWVEALVKRDTTALDRIMADDCTFTYPLEGDTKQQFIADVESGDLAVKSLSRENVEVRIYGHTAVLTGLDTADWKYKGHHIEGYYSSMHVYAEREGRWQLVTIQSCPIGD